MSVGERAFEDATLASDAAQSHVRSCPACSLAPGDVDMACEEGRRTIEAARRAEGSFAPPKASGASALILDGLDAHELGDLIREATERLIALAATPELAERPYVMPPLAPNEEDDPRLRGPHLFRVRALPGGFAVLAGNIRIPGYEVEEGVHSFNDGVGISSASRFDENNQPIHAAAKVEDERHDGHCGPPEGGAS